MAYYADYPTLKDLRIAMRDEPFGVFLRTRRDCPCPDTTLATMAEIQGEFMIRAMNGNWCVRVERGWKGPKLFEVTRKVKKAGGPRSDHR